MSSRGSQGGRPGCLVGSKTAEYLVTQAPSKSPDRFGPGIARREPVVEIGLALITQPDLGDGDPVAHDVARPDRDRSRAVVSGERRLGPEAADAGRLADDLGGGQLAAPRQRQE